MAQDKGESWKNPGISDAERDALLDKINEAHFDKAAFTNPNDIGQDSARRRMRERLYKKKGMERFILTSDEEEP